MKRLMIFWMVCCLTLAAFGPGLAETAPLDGEETLPEAAGEADPSETEEEDPVPLEDDTLAPEEAQEESATDSEDSIPDEEELEEESLDSRVMQYGDEGEDVLALQTRLSELKYYTGNLSGRYREGTREAVKSFQGDYGLEKTGIADAETQSRIYSARYRSLRYGAEGDGVKTLQTRLMELGYYKGKISGNYLGMTQSAIREFQENNGMTATGAADPLTQEALFSRKAVGKYDVAGVTPTPVPDGSSFLVDDEDTAANNGVLMADDYVPFPKQLKSGNSGKNVKELQSRLTALGYYTGPVSGNFAKQTLRAVKAVQTQNGVKVTGIVDEETWNVIFNDPRIVLPDQEPKPSPTPEPVPFAMTVDVTNQVTTVYGRDENGEYTVPVRRMLCSTGTRANPSDVGDWVLNGRHARWCVFPKWGNSYARYWTRINASIAFHSVIYTAVSLDAMKTSSYKALGSRASHGCIRLTVEDAKWVYDNIGAGTVVSIREDLPADPELRDALRLPNLQKGTSIPVATPVPTPEPEYSASNPPTLTRRLRVGKEGADVFWVQSRLAELGYYKGYIGGKMLKGTEKAVKAFQKDYRLAGAGEVDQKTVDALAAALLPEEILQAEETTVPVTTPSPTPAP